MGGGAGEGGGAEKGKSLESTAASGGWAGDERWRAKRSRGEGGGLVRSCMFGSIQGVHVVNMKAGILFTLSDSRFREACF